MRKSALLRLAVLGLAGVLGVGGIARADTIVNFTFVDMTTYTGHTVIGTVDIDTTTGQFETIQATWDGFVFSGLPPYYSSLSPTPSTAYTAYLYLEPLGSLVGFTGGPLDTVPYGGISAVAEAPINHVGNVEYMYFQSGSLVPTASLSAVPEPSTWVLTGTALLGGFGLLSRRNGAGGAQGA